MIATQVMFVRTGQTTGPLLAGLALTSMSAGTVFVVGAAVLSAVAVGQLGFPLEEQPAPER